MIWQRPSALTIVTYEIGYGMREYNQASRQVEIAKNSEANPGTLVNCCTHARGQKSKKSSQAWWGTPSTPALGRREAEVGESL